MKRRSRPQSLTPPPGRSASRARGRRRSRRRREQPREVGRVVGEVGVHLHHVARAVVERVAEAREVGRADAALLGAVQHGDPVVLGGQAVGDLPVPSGEPSSTTRIAEPSGEAAREHLAAAPTIASTFSASL